MILTLNFDCGCSWPFAEAQRGYLWDKKAKRSYFRVRCPNHPDSRLVNKTGVCEKCEREFTAPPQATKVRYCPACKVRYPTKKGMIVERVPVNRIQLTIKEPDRSPCSPSAGCEFRDGDKNGFDCVECEYRVAYWKMVEAIS